MKNENAIPIDEVLEDPLFKIEIKQAIKSAPKEIRLKFAKEMIEEDNFPIRHIATFLNLKKEEIKEYLKKTT